MKLASYPNLFSLNVPIYHKPLYAPPPLVRFPKSHQKLSTDCTLGKIDKYNQANNEMRNHNGKYICLARSNLISGSDDHSNFQIFIRGYLDYAFSNFISIDTRIWNTAYMNYELIINWFLLLVDSFDLCFRVRYLNFGHLI